MDIIIPGYKEKGGEDAVSKIKKGWEKKGTLPKEIIKRAKNGSLVEGTMFGSFTVQELPSAETKGSVIMAGESILP